MAQDRSLQLACTIFGASPLAQQPGARLDSDLQVESRSSSRFWMCRSNAESCWPKIAITDSRMSGW